MLHPGVGRGGEIVDLPVQKDNLGFPIIFSSSLKGPLKSLVWIKKDKDVAEVMFGPDPDSEKSYTAAIVVTDGFLVSFPVRSLVGVYGFMTSPILLKRLREGIRIIRATSGDKGQRFTKLLESVESVVNIIDRMKLSRDEVLMSDPKMLLVEDLNKIVINEEIFLKHREDKNISKAIKDLEEALRIEAGRLLIVNDDTALDAIKRSLFKVARIRLKRETKTVATGGLWTEEYIPQWTIFYALLLYSEPKRENAEINNEKDVRGKLIEVIRESKNYLIIGGNETVGRGIVRLDIIEGEESGAQRNR